MMMMMMMMMIMMLIMRRRRTIECRAMSLAGCSTHFDEEILSLKGDQGMHNTLKGLHGLIIAQDTTSQGLPVDRFGETG